MDYYHIEPEAVYEFMARDDMRETHEDGVSIDAWLPSETSVWLGAYDGGIVVGVVEIRQETMISMSIHPRLIKSRRRYCRDFINHVIGLCFSIPQISRVEVSIPAYGKTMINLAGKLGFSHEGVRRSAYLHDGHAHDIHIFGMLK